MECVDFDLGVRVGRGSALVTTAEITRAVYASAAPFEDGRRCRRTYAFVLVAPSGASGRNKEINQEEAAERCRLHRTYYSGIERGLRNVSLVNVEKVSKGLRTALPRLFERV